MGKGENQLYDSQLGALRIFALAVPDAVHILAKPSDPATNLELQILHWLTKHPLMSALDLDLALGTDYWVTDKALRNLVGKGYIERIPFSDPDFPSRLVLFLPTDKGLGVLAESERLTRAQAARRRGLAPGRVYRILNSFPWFYGLRRFTFELYAAARQHGHQVVLFEEEPLFHYRRLGRLGRFRADAFLVYRAKDQAYPLILLYDPGYLPVEDFALQTDPLADLREATDSPFPGDYAAFPTVAVVTTSLPRLLAWRKSLDRSRFQARAWLFNECLALEQELLPDSPEKPWRFFEAAWYGYLGVRVRLFQGARPVPWEKYRDYVATRNFGSIPFSDERLHVLGTPLLDRARDPGALASLPQSEALALINLTLNHQEKEILLWNADHPLLHPKIVASFTGVTQRNVAKYLARMEGLGLLTPIRFLGAAQNYLLSPRGIAWYLRRGRDRHPYVGLRQWRGEARRLAWFYKHSLRVQEVMAGFHNHRSIRSLLGQGISRWENDFRREQHFRYLEKRHYFNPDAFAVFGCGGIRYPFYLEVDRATERGKKLQRKAQTYYAWRRSELWKEHTSVFPSVLIVTEGPHGMSGRQRAKNILSIFQTASEGILPVFVTTFRQFREHGPLGRIWLMPGREDPVGWPIFDAQEVSHHTVEIENGNQG